MKISKHLFLQIWMAFGIFSLQAQDITLGMTANFGKGIITTNYPDAGTNQQNKYAFSGYWGMFFEKQINQKSHFGVEVLWVQMAGKTTAENIPLTESGTPEIGFINRNNHWRSHYIGLPIYFRWEVGKLGFRGALQPMIFISNTTKTEGEIEYSFLSEPVEFDGKITDIKLNRFDIGPIIGINYRISKMFRIRADYYHGLVNIESDDFPWQGKNRQMSMGIDYLFK